MDGLSATGRVWIVGAGPGDPELITLRGQRALQQAQVIVYDYLANEAILEHAPPQAQRICLGRHGRGRLWSQEQINRALVDFARQGLRVVRLKGGDPAIYGHLAEELQALVQHQIPFEIVPGVTAGIAAAAYTGVALTDRDASSAVAFFTGQEAVGKEHSAVDFHALAQFPGTLVAYMGVTTVQRWTEELLKAGKDPQTPALIVRRCTLPDQVTIPCALHEVPRQLQAMRPPVVVLLGPAARWKPETDWFARRPLRGIGVLVTRPARQPDPLSRQLAELGAMVYQQPMIAIGPPADWKAVDRCLEQLEQFQWLVFTSRNGVDALLTRLWEKAGDLRRLGPVRLAAIGPGTAQALEQWHLRADLVPPEYRAESLAQELGPRVAGQRVLWARANRGRPVLREELRKAGADLTEVVVYQSVDVAELDEEVREALEAGRIQWVTVTSSAIARALVRHLGPHLHRLRIASLSPVTSQTLHQLGCSVHAEAQQYTMDGLVQALLSAHQGGSRPGGQTNRAGG